MEESRGPARAGLELVAESAVIITPGLHIELEVAFDHQDYPEWRGSDTYLLNGTVLAGRRVGGSGRHRTYRETSLPLGLGTVEAAPALAAPFPEYVRRVRVRVQSNMFLDPGQLVAGLAVQWVDGASRVILDAPLRRPDVRVDWPGRGGFRPGPLEAGAHPPGPAVSRHGREPRCAPAENGGAVDLRGPGHRDGYAARRPGPPEPGQLLQLHAPGVPVDGAAEDEGYHHQGEEQGHDDHREDHDARPGHGQPPHRPLGVSENEARNLHHRLAGDAGGLNHHESVAGAGQLGRCRSPPVRPWWCPGP